jgi:CxxC-x17-CxxC domain-containing protein
MTNFKKPYGGGGRARPQFNRNAPAHTSRPGMRSGGGYRGTVQKFDAVCDNCGKSCQVPFRPDGKKPVYCKNCFDAPRSMHPALKGNSPVNTEHAMPSGEGKTIADLTRQIAAMNTKIDTMLKILEGEDA